MSERLPTGTVTLLFADVASSTRLWETEPEAMTAAVARPDDVAAASVAAHAGVRLVEQGEGDSFVVAFSRASDALRCAIGLPRTPLAPIRAAHRGAHRRDGAVGSERGSGGRPSAD